MARRWRPHPRRRRRDATARGAIRAGVCRACSRPVGVRLPVRRPRHDRGRCAGSAHTGRRRPRPAGHRRARAPSASVDELRRGAGVRPRQRRDGAWRRRGPSSGIELDHVGCRDGLGRRQDGRDHRRDRGVPGPGPESTPGGVVVPPARRDRDSRRHRLHGVAVHRRPLVRRSASRRSQGRNPRRVVARGNRRHGGARPEGSTYAAGRRWLMQGNAKVLETLADLLASELSAASTYFVHSKMRDNWGYPDLAKRAYDDSMDEMRHAEKLIERIIYFEGTTKLQRLNRIRVGSGVTDQLLNELALEKATVDALVAAIALCREVGDDGSRLIFEPMLADGEGSIDWLETQLDLIGKLGEPTYLAQHIRGE